VQLAAYAKGRAPYVGGIRTGDDISSNYKSCSCRVNHIADDRTRTKGCLDLEHYVDSANCEYQCFCSQGATTYATIGTTVDFDTGAEANFNRILKVSMGELRTGATGRIVFNAASSVPNISIIP
jgi:hypothetical protein